MTYDIIASLSLLCAMYTICNVSMAYMPIISRPYRRKSIRPLCVYFESPTVTQMMGLYSVGLVFHVLIIRVLAISPKT